MRPGVTVELDQPALDRSDPSSNCRQPSIAAAPRPMPIHAASVLDPGPRQIIAAVTTRAQALEPTPGDCSGLLTETCRLTDTKAIA
jgi:hypothetical protein